MDQFEIRDEQVEDMLKELGTVLREVCASIPGFGFALLIFKFGKDGEMFYTSNAQRESVIAAMEEFIAKYRVH